MSDVHAKIALDKLYAELPSIDCQRLCAESCGPVMMGRVEWQRICKRVGHEPRGDLRTLECPLLKDGLCLVYTIRPMICRLWGLVEEMRCPWGCEPERMLTRDEGFEFLARAREIQEAAAA